MHEWIGEDIFNQCLTTCGVLSSDLQMTRVCALKLYGDVGVRMCVEHVSCDDESSLLNDKCVCVCPGSAIYLLVCRCFGCVCFYIHIDIFLSY